MSLLVQWFIMSLPLSSGGKWMCVHQPWKADQDGCWRDVLQDCRPSPSRRATGFVDMHWCSNSAHLISCGGARGTAEAIVEPVYKLSRSYPFRIPHCILNRVDSSVQVAMTCRPTVSIPAKTCIVRRLDSLDQEVVLSKKAIGSECLDKV